MKLIILTLLVVTFNCKMMSLKSLGSSIQSEDLTWNLYIVESNLEPNYSCPIKINFQTNKCTLQSSSIASGFMTIDLVTEKDDNKNAKNIDLSNVRLSIKGDKDDSHVQQNPNLPQPEGQANSPQQGSHKNVAQIDLTKFLQLKINRKKYKKDDPNGLNPGTGPNPNVGPQGDNQQTDGNQNTSSQGANQDSPQSIPPGSGKVITDFTSTDPNNNESKEECQSEWMRWTRSGKLDTRYIDNCKISVSTIPNNYSVKFTILSRETQEPKRFISEFIISSKISENEVKNFFKQIEENCEAVQKPLEKARKSLARKICKKYNLYTTKVKPKNLVNVSEKQKHDNIEEDIKNLKNKRDKAVDDLKKATEDLEKCLNEVTDKNLEIKDLEEDSQEDNNKIDSTDTAIKEHQDAMSKNKEQSQKHQDDVLENKKKKNRLSADANKDQDDVNNSTQLYSHLNDAANSAEAAQAAKVDEGAKASTALQDLIGSTETERQDMNKNNEEKGELKNEKLKLDSQYTNLQNDVNSLTKDLNKLENDECLKNQSLDKLQTDSANTDFDVSSSNQSVQELAKAEEDFTKKFNEKNDIISSITKKRLSGIYQECTKGKCDDALDDILP